MFHNMDQTLAVIGMECWLPGARDLSEYWSLLLENRCAIRRVPDHQLDRDLYFSKEKGKRGKTYIDQGGLVDYPAFDQSICRYPTNVMNYIEVGHLMMVQVAARACRQAGMNPFDLRHRKTGVYVGNNQSGHLAGHLSYSTVVSEAADYLNELPAFRNVAGEKSQQIINEVVADIRHRLPCYGHNGFPTVGYHVTANAVSDALRLNGPSLVLDAACSSSLKALSLASHELLLGNIDMAIVGGASFFATDSLILFSAAQSGSGDGCFPFSNKANGLISAEGYVAIVVQTLERALAEGSPIQAIIPGIGVSTDGRGKSLWAPRKEGQVKAIRRAYRNQEDLKRIDYVEAHATSTAMGDQTELEAMNEVFRDHLQGSKVAVGGVKANIGHALEAAGLAGLVKATLVLQNEIVPKQINSLPLNSKIDWESSPFYVPQENTPLPARADGLPRRAAVNSFGIGGMNVHVVLEEFRKDSATQHSTGDQNSEKRAVNGIHFPRESGSRNSPEPIAVVGIGAVLPGARTAAAFEQLLFSGGDPGCSVTDRWNPAVDSLPGAPAGSSLRGGFVTGFDYQWKRHRIPPLQISTADPLQFLILDSVDMALMDAGYYREELKENPQGEKIFDSFKEVRKIPREMTGVIVGATFDTDFATQLCMGFRLPHFQRELRKVLQRHGMTDESQVQQILDEYAEMLLKRMPAILDETGSFTPSTLSSRITKVYDFMGGAVTIETGHTVGLAAISQAMNALRRGECDLMVCAAGARMMGLSTFLKMNLAGELSQQSARRSLLDQQSDGQIPGEGAGTFLLKRLSDAERDGDSIHCVLHSMGVGYDPNPETALTQAMERAWQSTPHSPGEVLFLEGSAAPRETARQELAAIRQVYGSATPNRPVLIDRADPQLGHLLGVSGMASVLKANLQLNHQKLPASFGLESPSADVIANQDVVQVSTRPVALPQTQPGTPNAVSLAAVSSWDPCGSAYHLIMGRHAPQAVPADAQTAGAPASTATAALVSSANSSVTGPVNGPVNGPVTGTVNERLSDSPWRIVRFQAASDTDLLTLIQNARQSAASLYQTAESSEHHFVSDMPVRLAIVSSSAEDLNQKLSLVEKSATTLQQNFLTPKGIFYGNSDWKAGKIAFVFSGQGSQYSNMIRSLVESFTPAQAALQEINADLTSLEFPTFEQLAWQNDCQLGTDVFKTQLSLLCADAILFRSLLALNIRPDLVMGHSYGEFPALNASGAWTFREAAQATKIRCDAILECQNVAGKMLTTNWNVDAASAACQQVSGEVFVANINSDDQTVLGGSPEAIQQLAGLIKSQGGIARIIPVPLPFHTPLMAGVQKPLYARLKQVRTGIPQIPLFSSVTNERVSDPEQIRMNLAAQMTEPVRYVDLIHRLHQAGVTTFIECGPNQILTALHRRILASQQVNVIATDQKQKDGMFSLLSVRASLEVAGQVAADTTPAADVSACARTEADSISRSELEDWAAVHQVRITHLLQNLADQGGIVLDGFRLSPAEQRSAREIGRGAGFLPVSVEALLLASGGLENFKNLIESPATKTCVCSQAKSAVPEMLPQPLQAAQQASACPASTISSCLITEQEFHQHHSSPDGKPPVSSPGDEYCRFTMRVMQKALAPSEQKPIAWNGRALVVGENETSAALCEHIRQQGGEPVLLSLNQDRQSLLAEIARLWEQGPLPHLYLMAAHDADAVTQLSENAWNHRREQGVLLPYAVTWKWYQLVLQSKLVSQATLCGSSVMGGHFGIDGQIRGAEGGAIAGLVKSMDLEAGIPTNFAFTAKMIDFSGTESPESRARSILLEMGACVPYETEIGYVGTERFLVRPILEPAKSEMTNGQPVSSLPAGNWIVTGGGRGITHYLMKQAALTYGLNLHILGSSPLPELDPQIFALDESGREAVREQVRRDAHDAGQNPAEALRQFDRTLDLGSALHTLQREGLSVTYHQCDVAERAQIAEVLQQIRQQSGAITGILHGAGIEVSCRMENKDLSIVEKTYAIKVDAAAALMELTQNDPVKHFIGFGSIAGRMGSIGQSDYSMANDALAKLCDWYQTLRPECRVTCFHWGPWGEIGMAATPEMQANPILATMHLLSPAKGQKHFLNELVSTNRTTETLLIDWGHYKLYYPDQQPQPKKASKETSAVAPAKKKPAPQPISQPATAPVATPPVAAAPVAALPRTQTAEEPAGAPLSAIRRMVVRWVDGTTDAIAENLTIAGVAMIVGSNRDAETLAETLAQYGVQTAQVATCDDEARLMGELDRVWEEQGPVSHLFLMTGRDAEAIQIAEREEWASRRKSGFFAPFHLLRHWLRRLTEAGWLDRAAVVAATAMNGDFGIESGSPALESSGLAGLLKAIHLEHGGKDRDGLTVKITDFSTQEDPARLTACLLSELATGGFDIESAYVNGERRIPRLLNMEIPQRTQHSIPRGSTWVVTGGARGITAEVAKELGSHFGLKLHLLGSSPIPEIDDALRSLTEAELKQHKRVIVKQALSEGKSPEKEWNRLRHALEMDKNLREMRERQIDVTYHQCDLTDPARIAQIFQDIQREDGPICGLIHGAGIDGNPATVRNMLDSQFDVADRLIAIKVDAVLEMLRHTDPDAFRYFIGFGSISGRFGSAHASSYCSGNDMLCKIMGNLRRERPHCQAVGIHWHAWGEIGMMTRPVSYGSIKVLKMQLMPPSDGVSHLIRELEAGLPENEIVITDSQYYSQFYSEKLLLASDAEVLPSLGVKPATAASAEDTDEKQGATFPIVHRIHPVPDSSSEVIGEAIFFPESDPFLIDHRFRGRPLLPAVITMEAFAETVQQMFPDKHIVAIHDLELLRGLTFSADTAVSVQITADTAGNLVACELVCPFYNRAGQLVDPHRVYATGVVEISSEPVSFDSHPVSDPEGECHAIQYADISAMMYHGPVFQQARDIIFSETQGIWAHLDVAPIELLAGTRNASGWMLNPATVDACLYLCGAYVWLQNDGAVGLPKRIQQFTFGRLPRSGEKCLLSVIPTATGEGELIFHLTCYGDDGKAIFSIMNYHCQIVRASLRK